LESPGFFISISLYVCFYASTDCFGYDSFYHILKSDSVVPSALFCFAQACFGYGCFVVPFGF
jgi:hypothetical protein